MRIAEQNRLSRLPRADTPGEELTGEAMKPPLRILHVIPHFTPAHGGSVRVVYDTAHLLGARGHDVTIVTSDYGMDKLRMESGPFTVEPMPTTLARWKFYVTPALVGWARRHVRDFDVIHMHEVRTLQNAIVARAARQADVPFVLSAHGTLPIVVQRQQAKQAYDLLFGRNLLSTANHLVAVSPVEVDQYRQAGVEDARIRLIMNGLDLAAFVHLPARGAFLAALSSKSPQTKLIVYLGRVHQSKGINHLIEAFGRLLEQKPDTILAIVGPDDGEQARLESLARRLALTERVIFTGPRYGRDKLAALVDADVVALPSMPEIFGLVAFEALMCGAPVVVANDCGAGRIIEEAGAGYLTPYGDPAALAGALLRALTDPVEARQKVAAGQAFIRAHLDWNAIITDLENLYWEVICAPSP